MTDKLTDEQLREWLGRYPETPYAEQYSGKALITELLELRAERAKLEAALRREKFAHGDFPTLARKEAHARIDAALAQPAESRATERCGCNAAGCPSCWSDAVLGAKS
jgi:hypothetical protein